MTIQREVDVNSLSLNELEIWLTMGVLTGTPDSCTLNLFEEVKEAVFAIARPKYCYTIIPRINFNCGEIIADALRLGTRYAVIVATAGREVENLLTQLRDENIVKGFIADALASELVEATSRKAIEEIETVILEENEKISNSYSPGYCGWSLKEQLKLFSFFDDSPCGVVLNDSCLMLPIKSISAVLAIGSEVVKASYGCAICTKKDCYKKRV